MKNYTVFIICIFCVLKSMAQGVMPNLPRSLEWKQISTPHFRVIFPYDFDSAGQRIANTLEHLYEPVKNSMNMGEMKQLPVIIQNEHAVSNGFVTLGPRRSEFYTARPQNYNFIGSNDWLNLLAMHEFRHAVQFDKSKTGFNKFIYYVFGEFTLAAAANGAVPAWFWEGDAVGIETALSHSGRGRMPYFDRSFRANLLEKKPFHYSKQYLGSFKDKIPNYYVFGYHFTTYLKRIYGVDAMANIARRTWGVPFIPFRYSYSMAKTTGKRMPDTYRVMMTELHKEWSTQLEKQDITKTIKLNHNRKKGFTSYQNPQLLNSGKIVAMKSGLGDYRQFVLLDPKGGKEEKLFTAGNMNLSGSLSANGNTVVWNEYQYDPRWRLRTYSVIKSLDVSTGNVKTLTSKSNYTSADLSPDGKQIVTVALLDNYTSRLEILDAQSGDVINVLPNNTGGFYSMPRWDDTGKNVIAIRQKNQKTAFVEIEISSGEESVLIEDTYEHKGHPIKHGQYLYYNSAMNGIDNIYALNINSGERYRITASKYGAYNPCLSKDGLTIYYEDFAVDGSVIVSVENNSSNWIPIEKVSDDNLYYYQPMVEEEGNVNILNNIPQKNYSIENYKKKIGKLHSWGPYFTGALDEIELGAFAKNYLSTNDIFGGVRIDNNGNLKVLGRVSYQGWYPILNVEGSFGNRQESTVRKDTLNKMTWKETTVDLGVKLPFILTNNKFSRNINISATVGAAAVRNYQSSLYDKGRASYQSLNDGNLISSGVDIDFTNMHKKSPRDIKSRFGQVISVESQWTVTPSDFDGGIVALEGRWYFPGLFKHHSINFYTGYQYRKITLSANNYHYNSRVLNARGHYASLSQHYTQVQSNYNLPLLYPDLILGPWLYIKRIKAELFFDYGFGYSDIPEVSFSNMNHYSSTGIDLTFDFHVMRAIPQLEMGVRYFYHPVSNNMGFELLIGSIGF